MKLREPLDFYSVTDHGFYMGMIQAYADTSTDISQNEFAEPGYYEVLLDKYDIKCRLTTTNRTAMSSLTLPLF